MTRHYKVAGHTFAVSGSDELFEQMGNYEPFRCEGGEPLFTLTECSGVVPEYTEEFRQEEDGTHIICGRTASGNDVIEFKGRKKSLGCLICSKDYCEGRLIMTNGISEMVLNSALMIMFTLATAGKGTLLFHAAVVSQEAHRGNGTGQRRQSGGERRGGLWLALERQDTVLQECQRPHWRHRHVEPGTLQQDTPPERY